MSEAPLLEIDALRLSLKTDEGVARILDRVDLKIAPGEIVGLVGESGCGKSTIVRAVLGILPREARIDGGAIRFRGSNILTLDEASLNTRIRGKQIGFIPQDPYLAFNPVFTVGKQLAEILRWHAAYLKSNGERRRHLVELLKRVRMPDPKGALDRYPHQFSGGQRQRLLIAAALSCNPSLIVADEPTTALDVTTQAKIIELLRDLVAGSGTSMLFVTHDLGVVAQLCDRVSVMYAGQTVEVAQTEKLISRPSHPYTQALLACHPERATGFVGIPGNVPSPLSAPDGCRFAPRCKEQQPACLTRPSHLAPADEGSLVNCILFD